MKLLLVFIQIITIVFDAAVLHFEMPDHGIRTVRLSAQDELQEHMRSVQLLPFIGGGHVGYFLVEVFFKLPNIHINLP